MSKIGNYLLGLEENPNYELGWKDAEAKLNIDKTDTLTSEDLVAYQQGYNAWRRCVHLAGDPA